MSTKRVATEWKAVSVSVFLLLSVGLFLVAAPGQGVTWEVGEGECIQDAVDSAGPGDTVLVHLGEYHQSVEFGDEDDGITLQGDGAILDGTSPADDGCSLSLDAIILHGGVDDVTIEGFEIRDYASGAGDGEGNAVVAWDVGVDASTSDITVRENTMHDLHWNGVLVGSDGTAYGGTGLHTGWLIEDNTIWDTGAYGVECSNCEDSVIQDNIITIGDTLETTGDWGGILVAAREEGTTGLVSIDIDVLNNMVTSDVDDATYDPIGIVLEACNPDSTVCDEGGTAELSDVLVDGNILAAGSGKLAAGVLVVEYDNGNMALITVSDSVISGADGGNNIPDDGPNVDGYGIYLIDVSGTPSASIQGNTVTGSGTTDIRLEATGGAEVTDNVLSGSTYVIQVLDSDDVEVEGNVVSGATYGVWVSGGSDDTTITDNVITGNTEGVRLSSAGTGTSISFNTIDDNTDYGVHVMSTNSVTIDSNGVHESTYGIWIDNSDSVSITDNTVTLFSKRGITAVDSGTTSAAVQTLGNTVDSDGAAPAACVGGEDRLWGIYYRRSKGTIAENTVTDIKHPPGYLGCQSGVGIIVYQGSDVDVLDNHISDYQKGGIVSNSPKIDSGDPVLIEGNTVVGWGDSPDVAQNGIQVGFGSDGQVIANTVSGNWYTGADWASSGVLIFGASGAEVDRNSITTSQLGVAIETWCWGSGDSGASDNRVTRNRITDAQIGVSVASVAWTGYSTCDPEANGNVVDSNAIDNLGTGDFGVYVAATDEDVTWDPQTMGTVVTGNTIRGSDVGVSEDTTEEGEVARNVITGNVDGVVAEDTSNLEVRNNVISGNTGDGIESLGGNTGLILSQNTVRNNARGIVMMATETAERNVVSGHTGVGILVQGDDNEVFRNVVRNNEWGIVVEGDTNTVSRNTVNNNAIYGIWAKPGADSNTFSRNVCLSNGTCDLKDEGAGNSWVLNVYGCKDPP